MSRAPAVLFVLLLAACGQSAPAATSSTAVPTAAPTSGVGATPKPTTEPTASSDAPIVLEPGSLVETTADRLQLREGPGLTATSIGGLRAGTVGTIVEGPIEADGHAWYRIAHVGLPWGTGCTIGEDEDGMLGPCWPTGWVAGGGADRWLAAAVLDCPEAPRTVDELAMLSPGIALACFGGQELVLAAYLSPVPGGRGCYPGYGQQPEWLGECAVVFLQGTETEVEGMGPELAANVHPDLGGCDFGGQSPQSCPLVPWIGQWVTITGHYDDPAAATCEIVPWEGNVAAPDDAMGRHLCRVRFVLTAIGPGDAP